MKKLLLQLDTSPLASVFDQVVGYDGGADIIMSYGQVTAKDVRDLVHGCIFTRAPKNLHHTAIWIGGANMAAGEELLEAAKASIFPPFTVSIMLDSNGSNTTAVAAVAKIEQALGSVAGKRALVLAGTGPVGLRAAGLLSKAGARVTITSRRMEEADRAKLQIEDRFGGTIETHVIRDASEIAPIIPGQQILLNCGPAGVLMCHEPHWRDAAGLEIAVDLNAVPPLGIEGIDVNDAGRVLHGTIVFGALGVGNFKTKLHKACVGMLFERNDHVFDAESIAEVARGLLQGPAA